MPVDPGTASMVAGAISGVGGLIANAGNRASAREQMEFQKYMSNTAYQRASADMKKAGLNPALMYTGGAGGASTPAGAKADIDDVAGPAVSSALQARMLRSQIQNIEKDNELKIAQTRQANGIGSANEQQAALLAGENVLQTPRWLNEQMEFSARVLNAMSTGGAISRDNVGRDLENERRRALLEIIRNEANWVRRTGNLDHMVRTGKDLSQVIGNVGAGLRGIPPVNFNPEPGMPGYTRY